MPDISGEFIVKSKDTERQVVFGWASIALAAGGEQVVDSHRDIIDPVDLEDAAYEFVAYERASGEDHSGNEPDGVLVESMFVEPDKLLSMLDLDEEIADTVAKATPTGWWIGVHIPDTEAWNRAKADKTMFSIEGTAIREPVA